MSDGLPVLKAKEIIRILEKSGFYIHHQTGSHVQMKHREKLHLRITIPFHNKDIPKQVLFSILKQAELTLNEFNQLR
ncbi:MAG: type II toxin-antitoxin system HicA family toxin [Bacteroidetes bacterium]|nr:type II toxin-antitoxin system HicA family toxin [Bacteroidota bacterium]